MHLGLCLVGRGGMMCLETYYDCLGIGLGWVFLVDWSVLKIEVGFEDVEVSY